MGRFSNEAGVWAVLPFDIHPPDEVRADGNGGVTRATYELLVTSVETEITVRLDAAGIIPSSPLRRHALVRDAANLLVAAQICRKLKSFQDQANSLFADANIKLRLFFLNVAGYSEGQASGEVVVSVGEVLTDSELANSGLGLSVFASIKI